MADKRRNWKEGVAQALRENQQVKNDLLTRKDEISKALKLCGKDYARYDALKQEQREVIAKLAML